MGIDPREFEWTMLAACLNYDLSFFFDEYEKDAYVAQGIDELCLSCPVAKECFEFGKRTKSTGVFGGFYLENGDVAEKRNAHKTRDVAMRLAKKVYEE